MKRKHFWFPCGVANSETDPIAKWPLEDYNLLMRETDWEKWITDAQWRTLIDNENGPNRSKLKKRLIEWMVAMKRISSLDRDLYLEAREEADRLWLRFWAIQAYGRDGLKMELDGQSLDDFWDVISKRRKEED